LNFGVNILMRLVRFTFTLHGVLQLNVFEYENLVVRPFIKRHWHGRSLIKWLLEILLLVPQSFFVTMDPSFSVLGLSNSQIDCYIFLTGRSTKIKGVNTQRELQYPETIQLTINSLLRYIYT
jgi:hypothetical protein